MMEARVLKKAVMIGCALVAMGLARPAVAADNTYWILDPPNVGDWFDLANWDNGVPSSSTNAYISNGGTVCIDADTASARALRCGNGQLDFAPTNPFTRLEVTEREFAVGYHGTCTVYQHAGTVQVAGSAPWPLNRLVIGTFAGDEGEYYLQQGSVSLDDGLWVGLGGRGKFIQYDGIVTTKGVSLGDPGSHDNRGEGYYELHAGRLDTTSLIIGYDENAGHFRQLGGVVEVAIPNGGRQRIRMGSTRPLDEQGNPAAIYDLQDGLLTCEGVTMGYCGDALFRQSGGCVVAEQTIDVGYTYPGACRYELQGGDLEAAVVAVGNRGEDQSTEAEFLQSGGTVKGQIIYVNRATWQQTGGSVAGQLVHVGYGGFGPVEAVWNLQRGNITADEFYVGRPGGVSNVIGRVSVGDGEIAVGRMQVADCYGASPSYLNLAHSNARIRVSEWLKFGSKSVLTAVPGAAIHMTGAAFENASTDPDALAGLGNLNLIFEGGTGDTDPVEIAGEDRGPVYSGFVKNFTFGGLTLGGTDAGQIQLADSTDNGNRGGPAGAAEAQYVKRLRVGAGSTLDLGGLNLYYLTGSLDPGATIFTGGGNLTWVPAVETVNATYLDSTFSPTGGDHGLGALTVTDAADIVVETADGSQTTHAAGRFTLTASLFSDTSTGGVAKGLFQGGTIDIEDAIGDDLLTADLLNLLLEEVQGQDFLAGIGWFELTGGSLEGGFSYPVGEMVQITFRIAPSDIDDFSQAFTGVSNITLTPEPATLGLLAAGLAAVWMRKQRVTK